MITRDPKRILGKIFQDFQNNLSWMRRQHANVLRDIIQETDIDVRLKLDRIIFYYFFIKIKAMKLWNVSLIK